MGQSKNNTCPFSSCQCVNSCIKSIVLFCCHWWEQSTFTETDPSEGLQAYSRGQWAPLNTADGKRQSQLNPFHHNRVTSRPKGSLQDKQCSGKQQNTQQVRAGTLQRVRSALRCTGRALGRWSRTGTSVSASVSVLKQSHMGRSLSAPYTCTHRHAHIHTHMHTHTRTHT